MLYVVATPIGNLEDITIRAVRFLRNVDIVLAEDTRKTTTLLKRYEIKKPLLSFHDHNKKTRTKQVLALLEKGKEIALVSSAGTPGISDPGFYLLRACATKNITFTAAPGPTAVINALVLSGLPTDKFFFVGFLSPKRSRRAKELKELSLIKTTFVFFESCHRVTPMLNDVGNCFGDKKIAVVKEMTKVYEEVLRGDARSISLQIKKIPIKGEFAVVVDNR